MPHYHRLLGFFLVFLSVAAGELYAQSGSTIEVAHGDIASLVLAIEEANERSLDQTTTIEVDGDFRFTATDLLPPIIANITIRGPGRFIGASQMGDDPGPEQLFQIEQGAALRLDNLELMDFSLGRRGRDSGFIVNDGSLHLKQVQISSIWTNRGLCKGNPCDDGIPLIRNQPSGELRMDQVSVVNSGFTSSFNFVGGGVLRNLGSAAMTNTQIYLSRGRWTAPFFNSGSLDIRSSTVMLQADRKSPVFFHSSGSARILNSVLSGFSGSACEQLVSAGFNLTDAQDCSWSSQGDIVGVPTGLVWQQAFADWTHAGDEILTLALVPQPASPAVDSADCSSAATGDLLNDRRPQGVGCDRGAVEATKVGLAEGGINGFYVNPDADGNYVYITQTDFLTLLVWNTFDADGNPAWIFATGELIDGKSLVADAYVNRTSDISPGRPGAEAEAERWGTIELEMTSCLEGNVTFTSDDPAFGSGQFSIERLAFVKQLGCAD